MKGENAIMNEALGRKTDSERGTIISELPEFLTIQLQRFTFCLKTFRQIKLNNVIEFPFVLDLNKVMSVTTQISGNTSIEGNYIYDLHAVVIHLGSVTSGHYFAYALHEKHDQKQWYVFNDASVTEMSEENVRSAFGKASVSSKSEEKSTLRDALSAAREGLQDVDKNKKNKKKSRRKIVVNAYKHAYVLLYRRRDENNSKKDLKTEIPKEILESIERDNEKYVEAKKKYEYERNMIRFRIHRENTSVVSNLRMHNSKSVKMLKEKVEQQKEKEFRLRIYDQFKNLRRQPLQDDAILSEFLDPDSIVHLWVETKQENDEFEKWIENGIVVKLFRLLDDRDEYDEKMRQCVVSRKGTSLRIV